MTTTGVGAGSRAAGGTVGETPAAVETVMATPALAAEAAALGAYRAEALAQLQAALAALGRKVPVPAVADPDDLRRAAGAVLAAEPEVERAERALAEMPSGDPESLRAAETALADRQEAAGSVPAARRRAQGAVISGTGMAILIATLGWHPGWYAVPLVLVAVMVADLRASVSASRYTSVRAAQLLAQVGVAGPEGLNRALARQREWEAMRRRVEAAHLLRDGARARWEELAPGTQPAEVEFLVERLAARSPAEPPAGDRAGEAPRSVPEAVRTLAETLAEESRREIVRTEQALGAIARRLGLGPLPPAEVAAAVAAQVAAAVAAQAAWESGQITVSAPPPKRGSH